MGVNVTILISVTLSIVIILLLASRAAESLYDDFMYRVIIVGVAISTDRISSVPGINSMEYRFREVIFTSLTTGSNAYNGNMTDDRTSNLTVIPIDLNSNFTSIPEISILVSLANCQETKELNAKVTALYGPVAHIAITEPGCPRLNPATSVTIPLTQFRSADEVLQLIVDMRQLRVFPHWKSVAIIYDKSMDEYILAAILEGLKTKEDFPEIAESHFIVNSRNPSISYERQLEDVFNKYPDRNGNFLVVTTVANTENTLSLAKRMGMLTHTTQWLFLSPDGVLNSERRWIYVTDRIISDGVNVAFISNQTQGVGGYDQILCSLQEILTSLTRAIEDLATQEYNLYLQISDEEWENRKATREIRVTTIIANATTDIDEITQEACQNTYNPSWRLEATENGQFGKRVFDVGTWVNLKGLQVTDDLFPHVVGGFRGRKIKITSFNLPPWHIFKKNETTGEIVYTGLIFEIVNHLGKVLNFTYEVIEPTDGATWGEEKFDGTWTGMMRLVINEEVILGAAAFTKRPEKSRVVNFTMTIEREAYTFMVNRPSELSRVLLFAEPFSPEVWICIASSVVLVAPIFYLIHRYSVYYDHYKKRSKRGLFLLKNCFLYVYGALLQQGGSQLPEAVSGRMLIGFWWLFTLVTVTTYSGNLVAFLTFPRIEAPVNKIQEVVDYKGVSSWGFLAGSVIENHIKDSNKTDIMKLHRHALKHSSLNDTVLDMIRFGNHAYIDWKISLMLVMKEYFLKTGKCEFVLGKEEIFEEQIALIVPRTSPYLQKFNNEIKWMLQSGLIKRWKSKYWPKKDRCSQTIAAAAVNRTVKIGDMQGSFYLLMLGFLVAAVALAVEFFIFRRRQGRIIDSIKIFVTSNKNQEFWQQKQYPYLH